MAPGKKRTRQANTKSMAQPRSTRCTRRDPIESQSSEVVASHPVDHRPGAGAQAPNNSSLETHRCPHIEARTTRATCPLTLERALTTVTRSRTLVTDGINDQLTTQLDGSNRQSRHCAACTSHAEAAIARRRAPKVRSRIPVPV